RGDARIQRLLAVEGIGPISASAVAASAGDARQFRTGRQFAAWLGLVPRQHSTGGQQRLGNISKRGPPLAAIAIAAMSLYALGRWIWYRPLRNATEEQIVHAA
ncbi:transposase, partial [Pseudomonas aeruginosa]|uniref:transposase n=1 Tax=Pseudomonas aeruginosa TaxID=287 RepID=UPI001CF06027